MKIIILLILIFPLVCYSQTKVGLKAGYGISFPSNYGNAIGSASGGLVFKINVKNSFCIQTEVLYSLRGYSYNVYSLATYNPDGTVNTPSEKFKYGYDFHYLEIPILARYNFKNFYINAGTSLSFVLFGKFKYPTNGGVAYQTTSNNNTFDSPLITSIGHEFKTKSSSLVFIEARQLIGLNNILNAGHNKLNYTSVSVGYMF